MKSNSLKYTKTVAHDGGRLKISICLNDECNNGHQDFAITADFYKDGRWQSGGCLHEDILKVAPELEMFVKLHLADFNGIPMYAVEDGFYRLNKMTSQEFFDCYRIKPEHHEILKLKAKNEGIYAFLLRELGILDQWKAEGQDGIKRMEELTGQEFLNDSVRDNFSSFQYIREDAK